ncbi:MAG: hypothetical protein C0599_15300, partial [Salinivirgaceae bacterium]
AFDMSGNSLVANSETPDLSSAYGSAYDNWTDPSNPKLWIFTQPGSPSDAVFVEFDINTLALTGTVHDAIADVTGATSDALGGGACTYEADGLFILAGSLQQDPNKIFGYELAVTAEPTAPGASTAFTATPDATGALTVDLAWSNPDLDVAGDALAELTSIDVYLDDEATPIYTNSSPTIGGAETYTATLTAGGTHVFTVIGTNSSGEGLPVSTSTFVGVDVEISSITLPETGGIGEVFTPEVTVTNNGVGDQTFDVTLDDGDAYSETLTVTAIASGANQTLTFPDWTAGAAMTYTFTASAADPTGDIDMTNNTMTHDITIFNGCAHSVVLTDSWGDGWNGASASVTVDGTLILENVTVQATADTFEFFAENGSDILFEFDGAGSYPEECSWEMFDGEGTSILTGVGPDAATANVVGFCGGPASTVTFNVDNGTDAIEGVSISIANQNITTDVTGAATIDLPDGDFGWATSIAGYGDETGTVTISGAAATVDITLTPAPITGAPVPTNDAANVISLFSDTYTDIAVDTWRTDWSSAVLTEVVIDGNPAKKYSALDFVGIETTTATLDASAMTYVHLDIWSPNFTQFSIKLVDFGPDGAYDGGDDTEHQIDFATPAQGEWVSLDIPLADFTGLTSTEHLAQYILVGQPTGTTIVYIDNFFFYNIPTPTYTITFNVTDGTNPIEGASIEVASQTLTTDVSGVATIDLEDGTHSYTVTATDFNDATGEVVVSGAAQTIDVSMTGVGIGNIAQNIANVYPNPAYNSITIAIEDLPANVSMQLSDLTGRIIYNSKVNSTNTTLDLTNYSEGTYILVLNSDKGIVSKHLIVKK